jgi:hypothetical protein
MNVRTLSLEQQQTYVHVVSGVRRPLLPLMPDRDRTRIGVRAWLAAVAGDGGER